jgi:hypothetical protein
MSVTRLYLATVLLVIGLTLAACVTGAGGADAALMAYCAEVGGEGCIETAAQARYEATATAQVAQARATDVVITAQADATRADAARAAQLDAQDAQVQADFSTAVARAEQIGQLRATDVFSPVLVAAARAEVDRLADGARAQSTIQAALSSQADSEAATANNIRSISVLGCFTLALGAVVFGLLIMVSARSTAQHKERQAGSEAQAQEAHTQAARAQTQAIIVQSQTTELTELRRLVEVLSDGQYAIFTRNPAGDPVLLIVPIMGAEGNGDGHAPRDAQPAQSTALANNAGTFQLNNQPIERADRLSGLSNRELTLTLLLDSVRAAGSHAKRIPPYTALPGWSGGRWMRATESLAHAGLITKRQGHGSDLAMGMSLGSLYSSISSNRMTLE